MKEFKYGIRAFFDTIYFWFMLMRVNQHNENGWISSEFLRYHVEFFFAVNFGYEYFGVTKDV